MQHSLHCSACSCAWLASIYIHAQTHLPCPARHSSIIVASYTCAHAFTLPNMAHVQTPLASCCLNAVEQSLHLRRTYMYIAHASIHAVYIHIFMHICTFHIFMLAFMLGACVARPWIYSYSKVCHTRKQCARLFAAWAIAVIACVQIDLRSIWDRS